MTDLASGAHKPDNGYEFLQSEQTQGRFACRVAIAAYAPIEDQNGLQLRLSDTKPDDQACWVEAFRGVNEIRDLVFLTPTYMRNFAPGRMGACEAAANLGAPLLFTFSTARDRLNAAEAIGVLYDTATCKILATLHGNAALPPKYEKPDDQNEDYVIAEDLKRAALQDLQAHALACIQTLVQRDRRPTTKQPHYWTPPAMRIWRVPVTIDPVPLPKSPPPEPSGQDTNAPNNESAPPPEPPAQGAKPPRADLTCLNTPSRLPRPTFRLVSFINTIPAHATRRETPIHTTADDPASLTVDPRHLHAPHSTNRWIATPPASSMAHLTHRINCLTLVTPR